MARRYNDGMDDNPLIEWMVEQVIEKGRRDVPHDESLNLWLADQQAAEAADGEEYGTLTDREHAAVLRRYIDQA